MGYGSILDEFKGVSKAFLEVSWTVQGAGLVSEWFRGVSMVLQDSSRGLGRTGTLRSFNGICGSLKGVHGPFQGVSEVLGVFMIFRRL